MMPEPTIMVAVAASGLALSVSPGPSMFYVLSRSVSQGRDAGLASAVGLCLGGMMLAIASALGLATFFDRYPHAMATIQILGGVYLLWLGVNALKEAPSAQNLAVETCEQVELGRIFRQGVLVELFNPKTVIFLVAFVPQFVSTDATVSATDMLILSLLIPLTAIPSDVLVSWSGASLARRLRANPAVAVGLNLVSGVILVGLAARVLGSAIGV